MWKRLRQRWQSAIPEPNTPRSSRTPPQQITLRVLMIVHNPRVAQQQRLTEIFGWHDPDQLAQQYAADLYQVSGGFLKYQIIERIDADWFPVKQDGFRYTAESYLHAWKTRQFHQPDAIDYQQQVAQFRLIERFNRNEFDEVWFFAFPYSGDYESLMIGNTAFWCNSPPLTEVPHTNGRLIAMAFNYERGVECMLENFGHRVESIMSRVYQTISRGPNYWELFTRYDQIAPGQAQCGNVHFAPSSQRDYDWGNPRPVLSFCDDWYTYPNLPGKGRVVQAAEWGGGDMRLHHLWWLDHLPRVAGITDGVSNNWWSYITNPNLLP